MLSPLHRKLSYGILLILFGSGAIHFIVHDYFPVHGPFGPAPGPWEPWLLRLHGGAAMLSLIVFGTLLPTHVGRFWRVARNRAPGLGVLLVMLLLMATGYGLYYFGGEQLRTSTREIHIVFGFAALPAFAFHIWRGLALRQGRHFLHSS